jgi:pantothenate kinase
MLAGIDVGTSCVKVVMEDSLSSDLIYYTQRKGDSIEQIVEAVRVLGAKRVVLTGTGAKRLWENPFGLPILGAMPVNPIQHELEMQALGAKCLLAKEGVDLSEEDGYMVVSIGTGTSFSLVGQDTEGYCSHSNYTTVRQFLPGLSIGGGTLSALVQMQGVQLSDINKWVDPRFDPDILVRDLHPDAPEHLREMVLSSMGKLPNWKSTSTEGQRAFLTGVVKMIATTTMGHLMTIAQHPDWQWGTEQQKNVVFVGTPVAKIPLLRMYLTQFSLALGFAPHIPAEHAEYAAALGAFMNAHEGA